MIEFKDVTKYYGDLCALDHINLTIEKGQILGLLGPNGAGKTTSMRILTGYLNPTWGNITAKGLSIDRDLLKIKKMIGYLPESAPLYENMIVFDYLDYVAGMRNIAPDERLGHIERLADTCGLREVMHRPVHELSKGYKQRVGLAHAMMGDPEILVLDEPTTGLDPNQIVEIRDIIKQIGKEKTVILSTHILSEVEASCDRVVIIHQGRIVADGSTDELRESTESEYTVNLMLKDAPADDIRSELGNLQNVSGIDVSGSNGLSSVEITCRTDQDIRDLIYGRIKNKDWVLLEMTRDVKSLERIFGELTKGNPKL
ncbi:MAG: ATP-binding cassette domain-containing protein [Candidatus Latescibacteria bacterium]|nr:ATP-binding cassette domain-containing protein [bacterium]MBD3424151.1 ATP-binding cassette domain-containing protein [Candidatus Latescibacterota bacterium]